MATLTINNLNSSIAYCESKGLAKVFNSYAHFCNGEEILDIGFNQHSGYVYIYLENNISICSMLGHNTEYLINDPETEEELFFDNYYEAYEKLYNN